MLQTKANNVFLQAYCRILEKGLEKSMTFKLNYLVKLNCQREMNGNKEKSQN